MLRRNSSSQLGRSKSTSSVRSKHDSIDPEVARQHAHRAATLAFARAQDGDRSNPGHRSGNLQLQRSSTSQHGRSSSPHSNVENNGQNVLRRQQSVRFAGPNAVQRRQSIGMRTKNPMIRKPSTTVLRPIAITTSAPVPAQYRPPSRSSSLGKASLGKANNLTTLLAYDEYYTQEDDVASTPSSYRRIRKSKSMFTPLCAPDVFYTNGTPGRAGSSYTGPLSSISKCQTIQTSSVDPPLRAPKSMSFLRGGRDFRQSKSGERNDVAVQMARDRFFQQATQQRLREQPSFLFRSKSQRQEKPFRKSVRSKSGTHTSSQPFSSEGQHNSSKDSKLKERARNISRSLRSKLKRVFGRSKDESVVIPNQQVDARQTHVRDYHGDADVEPDSFHDILHRNDATVSRVMSRVPSLYNASSSQQLRSRSGSINSTQSNQSDDKSRVTSWNTGVSTITSQMTRTQAEREQQRLSIINENGTHVPSSSFTRPRLPTQFSNRQVPRQASKSLAHPPPTAHGAIDSARVYSALIKRLDENSPKARLGLASGPSGAKITPQKQHETRSSSTSTIHINKSPATIRHVTVSHGSGSNSSKTSSTVNPVHRHQWIDAESDDAVQTERINGHDNVHVYQWVQSNEPHDLRIWSEDDVFSPNDTTNQLRASSSASFHQGRRTSAKALSGLTHKPSTFTTTSYHTIPEVLSLTPQEMATRNEPIIQERRALRETRSTFFGGMNITAAKTPSPYRRALAEVAGLTELNHAVITGDISGRTLAHQPSVYFAVYHEDEQHAGQGGRPAYTESIYSRTTSGLTPGARNSALSLLLPSSDNRVHAPTVLKLSNADNSMITQCASTSYRPSMPQIRVPSSTESSEWKTWMSSEGARVEKNKENVNSSMDGGGGNGNSTYVNYAFPMLANEGVGVFGASYAADGVKGRHVREKAQMGEDDTDIVIAGRPRRGLGGAIQPLGGVERNPNVRNIQGGSVLLKPILKNGSKTSLAPGNENADPSQIPPPIPSRSPLRRMQSQASFATTIKDGSPVSGNKTVGSLKGRNVLHKTNASTATLRSISSKATVETQSPAKLVKRQNANNSRRGATKTPSPGGEFLAVVDKQFGSAQAGSERTRSRSRSRTPGAYFTRGMFSPSDSGTDREMVANVKVVGGERSMKGERARQEFSYEMGVDDEIDLAEEGQRLIDGGDAVGEEPRMSNQTMKVRMGSQRMVDLFLSSRRQRVASGSEQGESEEEGEAYADCHVDRHREVEAGAVFL